MSCSSHGIHLELFSPDQLGLCIRIHCSAATVIFFDLSSLFKAVHVKQQKGR